MERTNNIFDKIQELLGDIPGNLTILEQQVDADIQLEYYNYLNELEPDFDPEDVLGNMDSIFSEHCSHEDKKKLLVQMAGINNIKALRTLEKFLHIPGNDLKDWAILAYQENRLLIESRLMDENQVLIATGMGGKGLKLRYMTVLLSQGTGYSAFERKMISSEVTFALKSCGGETERIVFDKELCKIVSLIPLRIPLEDFFTKIIEECNQFGNFIHKECIITNVKILGNSQIRKLIRNKLIKTKPGTIAPGLPGKI